MSEPGSDSDKTGIAISRIIFLIALILLACYFVAVASTNVTSPFVIVSGSSMEPTYHAGDLLLIESAIPSSIAEGDVVVFHTPRKGLSSGLPSRIAHRVIGIQPVDGKLGYLTRGDNSDKDNFVVSSDLLIGTVRSNLGPIGKLISLITNVRLLLIIGLPIAVVGGVFWLLTREDEDEEEHPAVSASSAPKSQIPAVDHRGRANFVSTYDLRKTDRATSDVKKWLLTSQVTPEAREAFDDVTERLDQLRIERGARARGRSV